MLTAAVAGTLSMTLVEAIRLAGAGAPLSSIAAMAAGSLLWVPLVWLALMAGCTLARRLSLDLEAMCIEPVAAWLAAHAPPAACLSALVFAVLMAARGLLNHPALAAATAALVAGALMPLATLLARPLGARLLVLSASRPALAVLLTITLVPAAVAAELAVVAQVREAMPWAVLVGLVAAAVLMAALVRALAHGTGRLHLAVAAAAAVVLAAGAPWVTRPRAGRVLAVHSNGATMSRATQALAHLLTDWDGDGVGLLLGDHDCAPMDADTFPGAVDIPGNGSDENCSGSDARPWQPAASTGLQTAIPADLDLAGMNLVLITIDTLRADHTGLAGYSRPTTPTLDELAARSAAFLHMETDTSATISALPALFTSRHFYQQIACAGDSYPPQQGWHTCKLHDAEHTLAERLAELGMTTSAVVSHTYFNGWGLEQGFSRWRAVHPRPHDLDFASAPMVSQNAIAELETLRNQRFFLWVHYFDPHARYIPHPDGQRFGPDAVDRYDGEIAYVDAHIRILLNALSALDLAGRTVIAVTSDHGEEFVNEHGGSDHTWAVYDTSTRVPFVLFVPGARPARFADPVAQIDILPTLVHAMGGARALATRAGDAGDDGDIEGISLLGPALGLAPLPADRILFASAHHPRPLRAISRGRKKLIVDLASGQAELFDRDSDPLNCNDISSSHPLEVVAMRELLDAWQFHALVRGQKHREAASAQAAAGGSPAPAAPAPR